MLYARDYVETGLITFPALTTGSTEVLSCRHSSDVWAGITMSGSPDDVFVLEGSLDNSGWDNLDTEDEETTVNEAGTTLLYFEGKLPPYLRVVR